MSRNDDNMFDRWSRRKRAVAEAEAKAAPVAERPPAHDETLPEAELLEKLGLPDPDTLGEGDDFAAFLKHGVPEFLKQRALRRLWLSNPALANLDGLLDYGEDFTDAAMVPDVVATAYRVGKGMLRDIVEEVPDTAESAGAAEGQAELADAEISAVNAGAVATVAKTDATDEPQPSEGKYETVDYRPRRMRFASD